MSIVNKCLLKFKCRPWKTCDSTEIYPVNRTNRIPVRIWNDPNIRLQREMNNHQIWVIYFNTIIICLPQLSVIFIVLVKTSLCFCVTHIYPATNSTSLRRNGVCLKPRHILAYDRHQPNNNHYHHHHHPLLKPNLYSQLFYF